MCLGFQLCVRNLSPPSDGGFRDPFPAPLWEQLWEIARIQRRDRFHISILGELVDGKVPSPAEAGSRCWRVNRTISGHDLAPKFDEHQSKTK